MRVQHGDAVRGEQVARLVLEQIHGYVLTIGGVVTGLDATLDPAHPRRRVSLIVIIWPK